MSQKSVTKPDDCVVKPTKSVFVIMPFESAHDRTREDLDAYFEDNLKNPIENEDSLLCRYRVFRSDNTLDITEKIIRDIFEADLVICDLSGETPNPNVMYELGMRFSLGHKPVILIREKHSSNKDIFDIRGFYTHPYSSKRYGELTSHLLEKIRKFETKSESYESPVLKTLAKSPPVVEAILRRQVRGIMGSIHQGFHSCQELLRRRVLKVLAEQDTNQPLPDSAFSNPWDVLRFLAGPGKTLPPTFFQKVDFVPPPIPGLLGYLTYHPLAEVVPKELATPFGQSMHVFYFLFFAGGHLKDNPTADAYLFFTQHLARLHDAAMNLEIYLATDSESERKQLEQSILSILEPSGS